MKRTIAIALACLMAGTAQANESCALKVARLLSTGQIDTLSALFAGTQDLEPALKAMAEQHGILSAVTEASGPRFKTHRRLSVGQTTGPYTGAWVNARSEKLGPIQLHLAQQQGSACTLLALHLDAAQR